jgi:hypothetical protein
MVRRIAVFLVAVHLGLAVNASAQAYNSVTLAWDANTEPDIAGYILSWGTASRTYSQSVNVGNVTEYTVTGLQDLSTYYFAVQAVNDDGVRSAYSAEVWKQIPLNPDRVLGIRTRLFWRHNTTGQVASWHMDGNKQISGGPVGSGVIADLEWQIVGTGDFNQDGYTDLVWHHNTEGWLSVWLLAGETMLGGVSLNPNRVPDTNWRVQAVTDINRDGKPDLIWQHRTLGKVSVWIMNGLNLTDGRLLVPDTIADGRWKIIGAGDYDGDGHNDLFWRHETTGQLSAWKMNQWTMVGGTSLTPNGVADVGWKVVAVTDFNGDGRPDLVWQHDNGAISTWILNGVTLSMGKPLIPGSAPAAWRIVGSGR